ncbi:hypothetical protein T10_6743 [Trichinella papuae]|uniref:Uncharacterized protein n=1 Tax=Trichinella papuae TaxID=268474 RepID=A0A0V1N553_9BILA|nr:hypothetical protein T10_6743 [Trichinella papuae]
MFFSRFLIGIRRKLWKRVTRPLAMCSETWPTPRRLFAISAAAHLFAISVWAVSVGGVEWKKANKGETPLWASGHWWFAFFVLFSPNLVSSPMAGRLSGQALFVHWMFFFFGETLHIDMMMMMMMVTLVTPGNIDGRSCRPQRSACANQRQLSPASRSKSIDRHWRCRRRRRRRRRPGPSVVPFVHFA